jgi:hypothetical protein
MSILVVDNFGGRLTRYNNGNINSGLAKYATTGGADPFSNPGQLTWQEKPTQIDSGGSVITDLIVAGKERVESGISYIYAVGHTGRVYKIQVNNPSTNNPDYDNPVLLTTLTSNSPTFKYGGFIDFFGATERIYIGHDIGVTRLDFAGTNETFVGSAGSYTANVPRPLKQFGGVLYFGNGTNLGAIDSTATVTTYGKFSPAFPTNCQVRDLDLSLDGNYLLAVVTRIPQADITLNTQDTNIASNGESYIFKWNGTDISYTAFDTFPSYQLTANTLLPNAQYTFGYDIDGASVYNPTQKIITPILSNAPMPNAVVGDAGIVAWGTTEFYNGFSRGVNFLYGNFDNEIGQGWWRQGIYPATGSQTDVLLQPFALLVSNFGIGASTNGYTSGVYSTAKVYFSMKEIAGSTPAYKFYKFYTVSTGTGTPMLGVYETQTQLFSKKVKISEVRVYGKPWVANNSFTIDIIGSDGSTLTNASKTFTAGTNLTVGDDFAWYNPACKPTYAIGLRITNVGTVNHTINKVEIEYEPAGK